MYLIILLNVKASYNQLTFSIAIFISIAMIIISNDANILYDEYYVFDNDNLQLSFKDIYVYRYLHIM